MSQECNSLVKTSFEPAFSQVCRPGWYWIKAFYNSVIGDMYIVSEYRGRLTIADTLTTDRNKSMLLLFRNFFDL